MMLRKLSVILVAALILAGAGLFLWASSPLTIDRNAPGVALLHANNIASGSQLYQEGWFDHDGRALHYVEAGEGEIILFIHGFPSFWYSFFPQMEEFKNGYRVVAIDGLGAGRSDAPRDVAAYRLEAMAAHVDALIDHLGADKVHLVGHDWGAAFALGFAQRYPERVMSVTAMSAPPQNIILKLLQENEHERNVFAYVERFKNANPLLLLASGIEQRIWDGAYGPLAEAGKLSPEEGALFRHATRDPRRVDAHINWYRANIPAFDKIKSADYWPAVEAHVAAPALFIWGTEDPIITPAVVAEIEAMSENMEMVSLEGVGHWPHVEETQAVNAAIRGLFSE